MRTEPHQSLEVFWGIKFNDGSHALEDVKTAGEKSEWFCIQDLVNKEKYPVFLKLFKRTGQGNKDYKSVCVGNGTAKSFFFSKRASLILGEDSSKENYGIGYHDSESRKVLISWYDSNLNLVEKEEREAYICQDILIPKITTVSSYQNSKYQYPPTSQKL
jgi:hypothetical protein